MERQFDTLVGAHLHCQAASGYPFPLVDANEEVERVVPMLASGAPAVLVQRDGEIIGVVTRADVLEYVANHRGA